ncbi:heat-inducible transcriptional repressor HrcA [Parvimonas sp. M13]|uniref:heat-inducible transcriptional repressor HrcA n=2 Tax=Parvimonas TaxID=543311 RepID=UPI002B4A9668|nr:heat-inducible transcriptional repressor HrcA [Parvimonas sp. M13]MEB3024228.1 heat-inducible transcriptional repressor HrcA [Parvimonas sp. M13]
MLKRGDKMLDDRKLKILYAIIDSYISTSEPIGSRTISKQYDMGVSSATVRNEMSDLEELGFLNKAYSSSGRIPSDKAYRHYVNYLLSSHFDEISKNMYGIDILSKHINEKNKIFKESAKIISEVTECITATMITDYMDCSVKSIDVINISGNCYVLVLVFDTGKVINTVFDSETEFSIEILQELIFYLKKYLINIKVSDLNERLEYLKLTFVSKIPFITEISDLIGKEISKTEKSNIELEGISNIFNFPEYRDLNKAKELIHFLEDKNELEDLFLSYSGDEIYVSIGSENNKDFLNENTIVATSYNLGDGSKGKIAVIGPTRMDYEKIISAMLSLNDRIRDILK